MEEPLTAALLWRPTWELIYRNVPHVQWLVNATTFAFLRRPSFETVAGNPNNKSCAFSHAQPLVTALSSYICELYVVTTFFRPRPHPPLLHEPTDYLQHLSISDHRNNETPLGSARHTIPSVLHGPEEATVPTVPWMQGITNGSKTGIRSKINPTLKSKNVMLFHLSIWFY